MIVVVMILHGIEVGLVVVVEGLVGVEESVNGWQAKEK